MHYGAIPETATSQEIRDYIYTHCAGEPVYNRFNTSEQVGRKFETAHFFEVIQNAFRSKVNPAIRSASPEEDRDIPVFIDDFGKLNGGATVRFAEEIGIVYKDGIPYFNPLKAMRQGKTAQDLLNTRVWIDGGNTLNLGGTNYKSMPLEDFTLTGPSKVVRKK